MPDGSPLDITVLVTRPREQAADLIDALEALGAEVLAFPVIDIVARDAREIEADAATLADADITVFVSPNAVRHGLRYAAGRIAAIGPSTAAAIEAAGKHADFAPLDGFDSEHLLAESAFENVAGSRVRIVRGNGGREVLANTLRERGADVDYLEVYERRLPNPDPGVVDRLDGLWRGGEIDAAVVMSVETLRNLFRLLPAAQDGFAAGTVLVTPAARVIKTLHDSVPAGPSVLARRPGTDGIVDAVASAAERRSR
jgi:uroporphyrinogen-III synthase